MPEKKKIKSAAETKQRNETLSVNEMTCILIAHVKLVQKTKHVNVVYKSHRKIDYIVFIHPLNISSTALHAQHAQ